jgi:hypothetical protein
MAPFNVAQLKASLCQEKRKKTLKELKSIVWIALIMTRLSQEYLLVIRNRCVTYILTWV